MLPDILLIAVILFFVTAFSAILYKYLKIKKQHFRLKKEIEELGKSFEQRVRDRTAQLELIRDSVSEYAVQKFELAQELELLNHQILKQKDDQVKQSEMLRNAYDEIKRLDIFKQQTTRMIVHDLKNPLNVLLNVAETITVPPESATIVKQISYEMLELILNILDVNKFSDSKMKIHYANFDLVKTVKNLFEKFSFFHSSVELKISMPEPCMVYSDPRIIERVLENLLSNAIKYTPPGGYIKIIATEHQEKISIEVKDNGSGIPDILINDIFNEYVQGEPLSLIYANSTGIGLTYCKLAVEAQGGEIGIISKSGVGTTVRFTCQKGFRKDNVIKNQFEEQTVTSNVKPELNESDIELILPYLSQIRSKSIYEASEIMNLLCNHVFAENERLKVWKEAVEAAAFSANEKHFMELTGLKIKEKRDS